MRGNELVGVAEIAAMLGVSRQRIDQLTATEGFPDPIADLTAGRIWSRSAVEAWMADHVSRNPAAELDRGITASLSDATRRVMVAAQETARQQRHGWVGTEHLLLALLSTDGLTDVVAAAAQLGIRLAAVEEAIGHLVPAGSGDIAGPIPFTPRAYNTLSLAKDLAAAEGHPSTEPRHLLSAVAREEKGVAASVLTELSELPIDVLVDRLDVALKEEQPRSQVATADSGGFKCNFCGKAQRQVKRLIAGPGIFICDECVHLCNELIGDEGSSSESALAQAAERLDALAAEIGDLKKLLGGRP